MQAQVKMYTLCICSARGLKKIYFSFKTKIPILLDLLAIN